jgi:hypothetical protein
VLFFRNSLSSVKPGGVAERLPNPERVRRPEERSDEGLKAAKSALREYL